MRGHHQQYRRYVSTALHPEHPKLGVGDGLLGGRSQGQAESVARVPRFDHPVVPEPGRRVVARRLLLVPVVVVGRRKSGLR